MTFWDSVRREISGTVRSIAYDARRRLRTWRVRADDAYPEYAAYVRRPRRALYGGGIASLAALGVAGTYLALAGGLGGWLLGENVPAPDPGTSGATAGTNAAHARRPRPGPTPSPLPPPATHRPHGGGPGGDGAPATHRATSTPTAPASGTPGSPTPVPTPTSDPPVTPTDPPTSSEPSPPDSPTPTATESGGFEGRPLAAITARDSGRQRPSSTMSAAGA